ncbi:MAG: cysteine--tRNA ligase [Candidatus Paceibacterota bacterium]
MLSLYNTITRRKEVFTPLSSPNVTMYNCGPTVYNYAHIGNLRGYVNADVLRRVLEESAYEVKQVINITDVGHLADDSDDGEDKIEKGAEREQKTVEEIIEFYTQAFTSDLIALNIDTKKIYKFPRATEHIAEQIELIKSLEEKGYAYQTSDGVYFDTRKFPEYGKLAQLDLENLKEGARVKTNPEKHSPTDFALWKFSGNKKRLQEWDSPWGVGFPGWHVECSAMSMKYLGETIDIHTGGVDHIPIHHTNEIAQSTGSTGKEFSRFWLHHEFVSYAGEKMAKSENNFIRLKTLVDRGYSPLDYRYLLLQAHYRTPISFSFDSLEASARARARLIHGYSVLRGNKGAVLNAEYKNKFLEALFDDLNTAEALAHMWNLLKDEAIREAEKKATLEYFDSLLGFGIDSLVQGEEPTMVPEEVMELARIRQNEKDSKNFKKADELRYAIEKKGYKIKDTPKGFELEQK